MRTILFFCLLIIFTITNYSQNFWEKINSPTTKKLNSVVFIDSLNGWAAGDSGLIIHTSDGGENWDIQFTNDSLNMVNLCFLNDQLGYGSASSSNYEPYGTFFLKTTDGGINWSSEYLDIGQLFVNSIYFLDSLNGFAVGYPGFFHRTTDGGMSWRHVNLDTSIFGGYPPYTLKFYNHNYGFASGGVRDVAGVIWRTTDSGFNWETVVDTSSAPSEPLFTIQIFDSLNVLAMGGDPEYGASTMRTTNGGNFWEYDTLGILWYPLEAGFRTQSEGWAPMGPKLLFLYTSDSGYTWSQIPTPDSTFINHICFPDSAHGFAVGNNGAIVRYTYHKPNETNSLSDNITSFYLGQNYPNPFNPSTRIEYNIPAAGIVQLKIYDILGSEVATLVNEYIPAGTYNINFNAGNLPSGIYFYKLQTGNYKQVRKMILLR
jgi:photosystem II stability/assembly factor-like uncharacterized protein